MSKLHHPRMVLALSVLYTLKMLTSAQSTCNGFGFLVYERVPDHRLQGYIEDPYENTGSPLEVLHKCEELCQSDRTQRNLIRTCKSFDFKPAQLMGRNSNDGLFDSSSCLLSPQVTDYGHLEKHPNIDHYNEMCLYSSKIRTDCPQRYYIFERHPGKRFDVAEGIEYRTQNATECQDKCLNEFIFTCRSASFNRNTKTCVLSKYSWRMKSMSYLVDDPEYEYLENGCLTETKRCEGETTFIKMEATELKGGYTMHNEVTTSLEECQNLCLDNLKIPCFSIMFDNSTQTCVISTEWYIDTEGKERTKPSSRFNFYYVMCLNRMEQDSRNVSHLYLDQPGSRDIETSFQRYKEQRLDTREYDQELRDVSVQDCLSECLRPNSHCRSVLYNYRYRECKLSSDHIGGAGNLMFDRDYDYFENMIFTDGGNYAGGNYGDKGSFGGGGGWSSGGDGFGGSWYSGGYDRDRYSGGGGSYDRDRYSGGGGSYDRDRYSGGGGSYDRDRYSGGGYEGYDSDRYQGGGRYEGYPGESAGGGYGGYGSSGITDGDISVSQTCTEEGMEFTLRTGEPFRGRIYTYGYFDRCFYRGEGSATSVLRISGPRGYPDCGTQGYGDVMTNIVVVQFSEFVQTGMDKRYNLTCFLTGPGESVVTSGYIGAGSSGSPIPIEYLPAENIMDHRVRLLIMYQGRPTTTIAVGDPLTFRIESQRSSRQGGYDLFATNVIARDPYSGRSIKLIDRFGCPTDPHVFSALGRGRDGEGLEVRFNAFKIPESNFLVFEATVRACRDGCSPVFCDDPSGREAPSFGRRRRAVGALEAGDDGKEGVTDSVLGDTDVQSEVKDVLLGDTEIESEVTNSKDNEFQEEKVREMFRVYLNREDIPSVDEDNTKAEPFLSDTVCTSPAEHNGLLISMSIITILLVVMTIVAALFYRRYRILQYKNTAADNTSPFSIYAEQPKPSTSLRTIGTRSLKAIGLTFRNSPAVRQNSTNSEFDMVGPQSRKFHDPTEPIYSDPSLFERPRSMQSVDASGACPRPDSQPQ